MSHIVTITTKVHDPAAVAAACQRLQLPTPVQGTGHLLTAQHRRLRHLQHQPVTGQPAPGQGGLHLGHEVRVVQLLCGDVRAGLPRAPGLIKKPAYAAASPQPAGPR